MSSSTAKSSKDDYIHNPNLSLKEKLQRRLKEKSSNARRLASLSNDPVFLNRWGPWVLLFLLVGAGGWGTVVAMPALYEGWWEGWLVLGRVWVGVMVVETVVNWSLTRWVGSAYSPDVHGAEPADFHPPPLLLPIDDNDDGGTSMSGSRSECDDGGRVESESCVLEQQGRALRGLSSSGSGDNNNVSGDNKVSCDTKRSNGVAADRSSSSNGTPINNSGGKNAAARGGSNTKPSFSTASPPARGDRDRRRRYDGYSYKMFVAVAMPTAEGYVERKAYPYWSWVNCLLCQRPRPPRCHHCTLCGVCVLKRDHHCYMTGACIGLNNHRFFLVFLFWGLLLTVFGTAHMLPYTFYHVVPEYNVYPFDFFPPVSFLRGLLGYVSLVTPLLAVLFWLLLFFVGVAAIMLGNSVLMLLKGLTSFERDNGIKVTDARSLSGKLRSVFGVRWWLNLLVPTYPWVRPDEDAVLWPYIKPC